MTMDVSCVLDDPDFLTTIRIQRRGEGSYVDGEYVASFSPGSFEIDAVVYQQDGKDFRTVPEGERLSGSHTIFSKERLRGSSNVHEADQVIDYRGFNWQIRLAEDWSQYGYFKSLAVKVDE